MMWGKWSIHDDDDDGGGRFRVWGVPLRIDTMMKENWMGLDWKGTAGGIGQRQLDLLNWRLQGGGKLR